MPFNLILIDVVAISVVWVGVKVLCKTFVIFVVNSIRMEEGGAESVLAMEEGSKKQNE